MVNWFKTALQIKSEVTILFSQHSQHRKGLEKLVSMGTKHKRSHTSISCTRKHSFSLLLSTMTGHLRNGQDFLGVTIFWTGLVDHQNPTKLESDDFVHAQSKQVNSCRLLLSLLVCIFHPASYCMKSPNFAFIPWYCSVG